MRKPVRIGVGGPVGSGKTALVDRLCRAMAVAYEIAVVTNDIYTREDAEFLIRQGVLPRERIVGVETGGCPHTASLEVMERDARRMRGARPFVFTDLVRGLGVPEVVAWIKAEVLFETAA